MLRAILEIAAVVAFRFPPVVRAWALLVALMNVVSVFFLDSLEGRVVLLALLAALGIMALTYQRFGFVRLLGIGHVTWFAMLPWLYVRLPQTESNPLLHRWLIVLIAVNTVCLIVDVVDVARFFAGDQNPHYSLREDSEASAVDGKTD